MDPEIIVMLLFCLCLLVLLCYLTYLLLATQRRLRSMETDNYRLLRRLGQVYNVGMGDILPPDKPIIPEPESSPVPAYFRSRKPMPPPGYRDPYVPKVTGDL